MIKKKNLLQNRYRRKNLCTLFIYEKPTAKIIIRVSQVALVVKNLPVKAGHKRHRFDPWVGKIPWRKTWQPTPVFLPEESPWTGAWWATIYRVAKSWTHLKELSTGTHNFIISEEKDKLFLQDSTRQGCPLLPLLFK